jgi:hypothetical protein
MSAFANIYCYLESIVRFIRLSLGPTSEPDAILMPCPPRLEQRFSYSSSDFSIDIVSTDTILTYPLQPFNSISKPPFISRLHLGPRAAYVCVS